MRRTSRRTMVLRHYDDGLTYPRACRGSSTLICCTFGTEAEAWSEARSSIPARVIIACEFFFLCFNKTLPRAADTSRLSLCGPPCSLHKVDLNASTTSEGIAQARM